LVVLKKHPQSTKATTKAGQSAGSEKKKNKPTPPEEKKIKTGIARNGLYPSENKATEDARGKQSAWGR